LRLQVDEQDFLRDSEGGFGQEGVADGFEFLFAFLPEDGVGVEFAGQAVFEGSGSQGFLCFLPSVRGRFAFSVFAAICAALAMLLLLWKVALCSYLGFLSVLSLAGDVMGYGRFWRLVL